MQIRASGRTDTGLVRSNNEDCLVVDNDLGLFAVLDGMGGRAGGEVAAGTAASALRLSLWDARPTIREAADAGHATNGATAMLTGVLADAVRAANRAVWREAKSKPDLTGMGCTITAVLVVGEVAVVAHVGDSRLYLVRRGEATQLSSDHTVVAELVRMGMVAADQARLHPQAHMLTRAVGADRDVEVESQWIRLRSGDRLLLCSDGLADYLPNPQTLAHYGQYRSVDQIT
jgi:PPM family protein phosphatase